MRGRGTRGRREVTMGALPSTHHGKPGLGLLHPQGQLSTQGQELGPLATCSCPCRVRVPSGGADSLSVGWQVPISLQETPRQNRKAGSKLLKCLDPGTLPEFPKSGAGRRRMRNPHPGTESAQWGSRMRPLPVPGVPEV